MPSTKLTGVLDELGGQGATLLRGAITAVSTGALTVRVNGDVFTRVTYLKGGWNPQVGEEVFLLNQAGFGVVCLGSPVAAAANPVTAVSTTTLDPSTLANWQISTTYPAGHWVTGTADLSQTPDKVSSAVWFYDAVALAAVTFPLASVQLELLLESGGPVELMLHTSAAPSGGFTPIEDTVWIVSPVVGTVTSVALPLDWGRQLIAGTARGITARSASRSAELFGHGSLTFTSL